MDIYSMNIYVLFSITVLFLVSLSFISWKVEKSHPKMRFLWLSSVISLVMALCSLVLNLYTPYASHSLLDYFFACLLWCEYPGFMISGLIAPLFGGGWYAIAEEPVWHCVAFVISFMLYTLFIFIVIRIALHLKRSFWSGKTLATHQ